MTHWVDKLDHRIDRSHPLLRRADEDLDARTRKDVFAGSMLRMRSETDMRSALRRSMADVFRKKGST